jgi:CBS domain containing-hemolysin-like protein
MHFYFLLFASPTVASSPLFLAEALGNISQEWESTGILLFKLSCIFLLVLLNGFFVASEFAIVKVRSSQLDALVQAGDLRAEFPKRVLNHLDTYLSATQLGITLSSLGLGWLGEPFLAHMIQPIFIKLGVSNPILIHTTSFAIAFSIITYLQIVLGELAPKSLAIRKAVPVALWVSRPLDWFYTLLRPVIWFLNENANWFLRHVLKVEPVGKHELAHSEEELRVILSKSEEANEVTSLGKEIFMNALDLKNLVVSDIMTPRGEVVFLDLNEPSESQIQLAIESRHTRFPLCKGHLDEAVGLVHIKDLLAQARSGKYDFLAVCRDLPHVPDTMPLEKLLRFFLSKKGHMAVAVDEYGGAVGIVTLDNVLEELVGSIHDEFDVDEEAEVHRISDQEFDVEGAMALYELSEVLGMELDNSEVSTIGGLITARLGRIPSPGEQISIGSYIATVKKSDSRRVLRVHLKKMSAPSLHPAEAQPQSKRPSSSS